MDDASPPASAVRGHDELRFRIVHAIAHGFCREAAEHHAVDRADAGAREHGHRGLGNHGKVDAHPIALVDSERFQDVGELADLAQELAIRDHARLAGFSLPDDRGLVLAPGGRVPIEAVLREIELSAHKPPGERDLPVEDRVPLLLPGQRLGLLGPEPLGIVDAPRVHGAVFIELLYVRLIRERGRGRKEPRFLEE